MPPGWISFSLLQAIVSETQDETEQIVLEIELKDGEQQFKKRLIGKTCLYVDSDADYTTTLYIYNIQYKKKKKWFKD